MLKQVDYLFHFTKTTEALKKIFQHGFKPSYANEKLADRNIKVPMVSFSNILIRDVGEKEVIYYGGYAICMAREWAIKNRINPVVYTYNDGLLYNALNTFIDNSTFLAFLNDLKEKIKEISDCKCGPISKMMKLTNTSAESVAMLDYLSMHYNEELIQIVSKHSKTFHDTNLAIITLTKPYKVTTAEGKEFIAYNDREWRKLYPDLSFLVEESEDYKKWDKEAKPHFHKDPYLLEFAIQDVKAVLVDKETDIADLVEEINKQYGKELIDDLLSKKHLNIGTKEMLEKENF